MIHTKEIMVSNRMKIINSDSISSCVKLLYETIKEDVVIDRFSLKNFQDDLSWISLVSILEGIEGIEKIRMEKGGRIHIDRMSFVRGTERYESKCFLYNPVIELGFHSEFIFDDRKK